MNAHGLAVLVWIADCAFPECKHQVRSAGRSRSARRVTYSTHLQHHAKDGLGVRKRSLLADDMLHDERLEVAA